MVTVADTAYSIAQIRADEDRLPEADRLFVDPYARVFAAAGEHAREATARFLALPFFAEAIRLRTRFNDDAVRAALGSGARQVVLMGAGFDMRALRIQEIHRARALAFEVDFSQQLDTKRRLLGDAGVELPAHVRYVACDFLADDFETPLEAALVENGFVLATPTVFVLEGVLPYIGQRGFERTLRFMAKVSGPGSSVVFELADGFFAPETAGACVARCGFAAFEETGFDELARRWLPSADHPAAGIIRAGIARK